MRFLRPVTGLEGRLSSLGRRVAGSRIPTSAPRTEGGRFAKQGSSPRSQMDRQAGRARPADQAPRRAPRRRYLAPWLIKALR